MNPASEQTIIRKIGLAVFQDGKILMARSKKNADVFYFPGGKIDTGETDLHCLDRESREELSVGVDLSSTALLAEFSEPAHNKPNIIVELKLYRTALLGEPQPASEIEEVRYFDSSIDPKHLDVLGTKVFAWLKEQGLIN
jgi:8-oxo-dGTP diphosphatase